MTIGAGAFSHLDSPSMHFAVGMFCTGVLCIPLIMIRPRWWPMVPLLQGLGGAFALIPDFTIAFTFYPRLFSWLGDLNALRTKLHGDVGNIFFFHAAIDRSGEGNFLRGFVLTAIQYNAWICIFIGHYYFTRYNSISHETNVPQLGHRDPISHATASSSLFYVSKQNDLTVQSDPSRRSLIFSDANHQQNVSVAYSAISSCEVLANNLVVGRAFRAAEDLASKSVQSRLRQELSMLQDEPMTADGERRIDLRIWSDAGSHYLLNFYYRTGSRRHTSRPLVESVEQALDWYALISDAMLISRSN